MWPWCNTCGRKMALETSMLTHVLFDIEGLIMSEELRLVQLPLNQYMNVSKKT